MPSMVVTDMMGEMDQDMLSLYRPLTPSLTDSSHHTTLPAQQTDRFQSYKVSATTSSPPSSFASFLSSDNEKVKGATLASSR